MNSSIMKTLAAIVSAATLVTPVHVNGGWTWECEDENDISVYVESGNTYNLDCGKLTSDRVSPKSNSTFAIETGDSTATVKAGEAYLKVSPEAGITGNGGGCFATLTLPEEVSSLKPEKSQISVLSSTMRRRRGALMAHEEILVFRCMIGTGFRFWCFMV